METGFAYIKNCHYGTVLVENKTPHYGITGEIC